MRSENFCFSAVRAVLYGQGSVRVLPIVLAAARRTPPVALLLSVSRRYPPDVVLQADIGGSAGMRTTR